jgi:serine/threonine-protein kinase RsbW
MSPEQPIIVELHLPSELGIEKLVRQTIAALAHRLELAAARVADLQTAASEACINAIEHGNQMRAHLHLFVTLCATRSYLEVVVLDEGVVRFQPPSVPAPTIWAKLDGLAPARGMGLMLMQNLVDEASFVAAEAGRGNRVRLRIYGSAQPRAAAWTPRIPVG